MKMLLTILLIGFVACHDDKDACIDSSKKTDAACYEIYQPVCGCDGKTYSNACFAGSAGVKSWKEGECASSAGGF